MIQSLIRAFFELQWKGNTGMEYVILEGEHQEGAVVAVTTDAVVDEQTQIPLIRPTAGGISVFVIHPQLEELSEKRWLPIANDVTGVEIDAGKCAAAMRDLRAKFLRSSAEALAKGKPVFTLQFDPVSRTITQA